MTYPQPAHELVATQYELRIGASTYTIEHSHQKGWDDWPDTPQDAANSIIEEWTTDNQPTLVWTPHNVRVLRTRTQRHGDRP